MIERRSDDDGDEMWLIITAMLILGKSEAFFEETRISKSHWRVWRVSRRAIRAMLRWQRAVRNGA